jgi:CzcA family heavy metal efflux pump
MLSKLIRWSLAAPVWVLLLSVGLVTGVVVRLPHMDLDVFPELNAPTVVVLTEAGGLPAEQVEETITFPLEAVLSGLPGARRTRSSSAVGLSMLWIDLDWGADLYRARQLVSERLGTARGSLPDGVEPFIVPVTSIAGEIMLVSLSSPDGSVDAMELRALAEYELRQRVLAVPGVAQASAIGGELPELQVRPNLQRLQLLDLSLDEVIAATSEAHSVAGAGYLPDTSKQEWPLHQDSRATTPEQVAASLVESRGGAPLTLGEVAEVKVAPAPRRGTASENGAPAVILSIQKSPGSNTLALTRALDEVFDAFEATLPAGARLNRDVVRQSHFIQRSLDNVGRILVEAALIVAGLLLLFLLNLRVTLVALAALPVALAAGVLLVDLAGLGLNVMTLGGLAVAIGVLVDDAIIDVENVHRRLRENGALPEAERRPAVEVIFDASNEIRPSMAFATVIIALAFVPLLFLGGLEGRFFQPLGLTCILSILGSLIVALTLTPALCRLLLARRAGSGQSRGPGAFERLIRAVYTPFLDLALRLRGALVLLSVLGAAGALALATSFGSSFLPAFNEGTLTLFVWSPPGTSLEESDRVTREIERQVVRVPGVRNVSRRTGRAERDEHVEPVSNSEMEVDLLPGADADAVRAELDRILGGLPGLTTSLGQPIEHRLSHVLSGTPAAIAINLYGSDLEALRRAKVRLADALRELPTARDVNAGREPVATTLGIEYRRAELAQAGLSPADAARQVSQAIQGAVVHTLYQGVRRLDLVVRLAPEDRASPKQVAELPLRSADGAWVRLGDVADLGPRRRSTIIPRENGRRKAVVSLNVGEGGNLGDLAEQVRRVTEPIALEEGLDFHLGGQFEARNSAARTLTLSGLAVLLTMGLLLQAATGSVRASLLILGNLPLALMGGILTLWFLEGPGFGGLLGSDTGAPVLSIASLIGFVTLFGIAVRNGILLVNHYQHLVEHEGATPLEALRRGSLERLTPILVTAISAALGLLPLALASGQPGSELLAPLAQVTLGGLLSSTLLNLIVIPAGYAWLYRVKAK